MRLQIISATLSTLTRKASLHHVMSPPPTLDVAPGRNGGRGRGRGGGRDNGRGRGGGQGGRGRGRGRRNGGRSNNTSNPGLSSNEWNNMNEEDKESIHTARSNHASKRNISAVTDNQNEEEAHKDNQVPSPKRSNANPPEAGDFMSRGGRKYISQLRTSTQYITPPTHTISSSHNHNHTSSNKCSTAERDSHVDTTVAGSTCRVIEYTEKSCDVHPFSDNYEPMKQVPITKVGRAYDDPSTGETLILIFDQALYLGDVLDHKLICPNQARANGVIVDDVPRHLSHDGKSTHSLFFPEEGVRIPLCS